MNVIAFYSFKGGVGRTQAVANVATELSSRGKRVIIVDMDLESPGVLAYFGREGDETSPGLLDYIDCWRKGDEPPRLDEYLVDVSADGNVRVMGPGRLDGAYARRVAELSWERFYEREHGALVMNRLRDDLLERADYVLLDSRTGVTDVGTVCTWYLPDVVVALFALHDQGINGTALFARALAERMAEGPSRLRRVILVPARVEEADGDLVTQWVKRSRERFKGLPDTLRMLDDRDGTAFRVPYDRTVAYGENIVVQSAPEGKLAVAYQFLTDELMGRPVGAVDDVAVWEAEAEQALRAGRGEEAIELFERVVASRRDRVQARPEDVSERSELAHALSNLAVDLSRAGRWSDALVRSQEAVDQFRVLHTASPDEFQGPLAHALVNFAADLSQAAQYVEAHAAASEAVERHRQLALSKPEALLGLARSLSLSGRLLAALGRDAEGVQHLREAATYFRARNQSGERRRELSAVLTFIARCESGLGRREEAIASVQEALTYQRVLARESPAAYLSELANSLVLLIGLLVKSARHEEALVLIEEFISSRRALQLPALLPQVTSAFAMRAAIMLELSRYAEAHLSAVEGLNGLRSAPERARELDAELSRALVHVYLRACNAVGQSPDESLIAGLPRPE